MGLESRPKKCRATFCPQLAARLMRFRVSSFEFTSSALPPPSAAASLSSVSPAASVLPAAPVFPVEPEFPAVLEALLAAALWCVQTVVPTSWGDHLRGMEGVGEGHQATGRWWLRGSRFELLTARMKGPQKSGLPRSQETAPL